MDPARGQAAVPLRSFADPSSGDVLRPEKSLLREANMLLNRLRP